MMFTCGLAADILFYSFAEWVMYAADPQIEKMGGIQEWAGVYPLFHWSLIPWGFISFSLPHLGLCCTCGNGTGSGIQKPAVRLWENRRTASADG